MRTISLSVVIITLLAAVSASGQSAQTQVTFTKDVAPIFQGRCQICHHPGTFAPMSLMTYEDARPWARSRMRTFSLIDRAHGLASSYVINDIGANVPGWWHI